MQEFKSFSERIKDLKSEDFDSLALEIFRFQASHNQIYRKYVQARQVDVSSIKQVSDIPFLPIRFFKDFEIVCGNKTDFAGFYFCDEIL